MPAKSEMCPISHPPVGQVMSNWMATSWHSEAPYSAEGWRWRSAPPRRLLCDLNCPQARRDHGGVVGRDQRKCRVLPHDAVGLVGSTMSELLL
jgi:hypothetical protein